MQESEPKKKSIGYRERKSVPITIQVYPRDEEMIVWITEHFGCSRSEAIRTAVRSMYAALSNERRQS